MPLAKKKVPTRRTGQTCPTRTYGDRIHVANRMLTIEQVMNRGGYALAWEQMREEARREENRKAVGHD